MDRATSQATVEQARLWSDARDGAGRTAPAGRSGWSAVKDPLFTIAAVGTILACVFGIGPFERPHGSHETFLASPSVR